MATPVEPNVGDRDRPEPREITKTQAIAELERRRALADGMGGPDRIAAQHGRGRLTARERVALLVDQGFPLIGLGDANGARLPDHLGSDFSAGGGNDEGEHLLGLRVTTDRFPRVTAALGNAYGDPAFWAGASDFVVMASGCSLALSGPALVGSSIGASTTHEELGGAEMTVRGTGLVSRLEDSEADVMQAIRQFLSYLPSNARLAPPLSARADPAVPGSALAALVPDRGHRGYDIRRVIDGIVDAGSLFELHREYARSVVVGLARIEGQPIGMLASQPKYHGGVLDADALDKSTRMVRLCTDFGLPLVFLQDLPGVMIGLEAERTRVAPKLIALYEAICRSPVPKVTVVIRKAFGFGYIAMGGHSTGVDYIVAWPNAEIGFMSADNAVQVLHHKQLLARRAADGDEAARAYAAELEADIHGAFAPWAAAGQALIHDVIKPHETRQAVVNGLLIGSGYR